jgi:RNA polymerase sigma-70 factor (ECF subfamily)
VRTNPHAKVARGDSREDEGRPASPPAVSGPPRDVNKHADAPSNGHDRAREAEEDRVLVARAQGGDMGAFRELVERHQRRSFALAFALVRDENDAREIVQDAFLRAFRSLDGFKGTSSFFTWIYRIITNLSIDLKRKPGRKTVDVEGAHLALVDGAHDFPFVGHYDGADPADVVRRSEIAARLQAALDALPSYHRAVIVLREVDGMSYEEIAQAMGVSKGTIMSRLFHARQKLQLALADCYREQVGARGEGPGEDGARTGSEEGEP